MKVIFTNEAWIKMGQPDLGSKIYLRDKKTSEKVYYDVVMVDFGNRKGIKMNLKKLKSKRV
jgi:hypothetical protein